MGTTRVPGTMPEIDFTALRKELLPLLRGRRSQARFSHFLGYRSNQAHRWETDRTIFLWRHFLHICQRLNLPLEAACRNILHYHGSLKSAGPLVSHLLGDERQADSAKRMGVSRSIISRWRRGRIEPSFEQILRIIHGSFCSLTGFLDTLLPNKKLETIAAIAATEKRERELHYRYPWVAALLLCLRTQEYNSLPAHREGFLARKLGITLEDERDAVRELLDIGALEQEGALLCPSRRGLNTGSDPEGARSIREYWTKRGLSLIQGPLPLPPGQMWGYMVFNTNPETARQIRERYLTFFQDLNTIIHSSSGASDEVCVLNVSVLNIKDLPS